MSQGEAAIGSVLLVIAALLLVMLVRAPDEHAAASTTIARTGISANSPRPVTSPSGVSLAVLPFVNMSADPQQEYFSDGLSEEMLNQLAQIKELRVTGRTSSFSFKGRNEDLRVIGEKLGVNHLLEGSVRKDGRHLRPGQARQPPVARNC
jgi:TolB-like protein